MSERPKEYFMRCLLTHGIKIDPIAFNNPESPVTCVALKFRTEDELPQMYDRELLDVMYDGSIEQVRERVHQSGEVPLRVVNAQNANGETILMKVCRKTLIASKPKENQRDEGLKVVSLLLKSGANPSVCCDSGKNVLHDVFWTAKPPPEDVLAAMEAIVDMLREYTGKNGVLELMLSQDKHGYTPLDYVIPSQQPNWKSIVDRVVSWATEEAALSSNSEEPAGDDSEKKVDEEAPPPENPLRDQVPVDADAQPNLVMELETSHRNLVRSVMADTCPDDRRLLLQLCSKSASFLMSDCADPDAIIVAVSPNFVAATGYSAADVLGRNCRFLQGPGTDTRQVDLVRRALAESATVRVSLLNYRKSGETFLNNFLLTPLRRSSGEVAFFCGIQNCPEDVILDRKERLAASGDSWITSPNDDDCGPGRTTVRIVLDDNFDDDDKVVVTKKRPRRQRHDDDDDDAKRHHPAPRRRCVIS